MMLAAQANADRASGWLLPAKPQLGVQGQPGILLTPSVTQPYWACPRGACDAIIEPSVRVDGRFALAHGGHLFEGTGEDGGYDPQDLQSAYEVPASGGATQTVAVVDAYAYPAAEADLAKYRERYGLPPCTKADSCFRKVNENGEEGDYAEGPEKPAEGWDIESAIDMDMVSAICPECQIMLVEASSEGPANMGESVNTAARLGATEISSSYGVPEGVRALCGLTGCSQFSADYDHPGVVVTASAGDLKYENELGCEECYGTPDFPAASPYAVAVGGTTLQRSQNARGWAELVWLGHGGTGGGCSKSEPKPAWQSDTGCRNRMDNDVADLGACQTPVSAYSSVLHGWGDVCGTSVSSPLFAAIMAHAAERVRAGAPESLYENPSLLSDLTLGLNGRCEPWPEDEYLCHAEIGYDGPTGLGSLVGVPGAHPSVAKLEPAEGPPTGGTSVTISGANLAEAAAVKFGEASASNFTVSSPTSISAVSPAGVQAVDVTVHSPQGTSERTPADQFSYSETPPEFGRCQPVAAGVGRYGSSACDSPALGGGFEWTPGVAKGGFSIKGGSTTFEMGAKHGETIVRCAGVSGQGEYAGTRDVANLLITLTGCAQLHTQHHLPCFSQGALAGEITTTPLDGTLQWGSKPAGKVVLQIFSLTQQGLIMNFKCGLETNCQPLVSAYCLPVAVLGSLLLPEQADEMAITSNSKVSYSKSRNLTEDKYTQKPDEYETASGARVSATLESAIESSLPLLNGCGLKIKRYTQTSEEPLEIDTFA